ncbi:MAG: hypothetical protein HN341_19845 [Verrucomicrobia bacterium]|mgnify:CR=1 FL=1|nr:hypothetical protein [Verrucomicrobiota bacterium]
MAGKRDIAWVADAIVTQLKSSLPAKLDALDIEYGDDITLEDIPNDFYYISERTRLDGFPLCCVVPRRTELQPFAGAQRYDIEYHHLTLAAALTLNEDEDQLKRRCLRTVRGIEEVLLTHFTLNGSVDDLLVIDKQYAPLLSDGNALLQEGQIAVRAMIHV